MSTTAAASLLEWLFKLGGIIRSRWRAWRYGVRVELIVNWANPLIYVMGMPTKYWRQIEVSVTASKDEEFVVAGGALFGRRAGSKKWVQLFTLNDDGPQLPVEVQPNRRESFSFFAQTTAERLAQTLGRDAASPEIRLAVWDYHGLRVTSAPLRVDVADLLREEYRHS